MGKKAMETDAIMEKWKNEKHVFPLSHNRLENSEAEFSTVPTASTTGYKEEVGKLKIR